MEYQNTQLYMECQLVAIWNAARFYGMEDEVPKIGTNEYEEACNRFACKSGSCLGVGDELNRLGLKYVEGKWDYEWIRNNLPVELSIIPSDGRAHAILAVEERMGDFKVANMGGCVLQWYSYDKLQSMKINNPHFRPKAIKRKKNMFVTLLKKLRIT